MTEKRVVSRRGAAAAALLATVGTASVAQAWGFLEHQAMGTDGYREACADVARELHITPADGPSKTDVEARYYVACREFPAALYGQACALAGDHVRTPEDLLSVTGEWAAASRKTYAFLALVNTGHFHPHSPRNWRDFHGKALEAAAGTATSGVALVKQFERAFYTSAFADHFLQDTFASGHMGFNRVSSSAAASQVYHDIWNRTGRSVRNARNQCWHQYGDYRWKDQQSPGREQLEGAAKASAFDLVMTFVTQQRNLARELAALAYVPIETTHDELPRAVRWGEAADQGAAQDLVKQVSDAQIQKGCVGAEPVDGINAPVEIESAMDMTANLSWGHGAAPTRLSAGMSANHLFQFPLAVEGRVAAGVSSVDDKWRFAPGVGGSVLSPPLYLVHGLWRNEVGAGVETYYSFNLRPDAAALAFLRSSLEVSTTIIRVEGGAIFDARTQSYGFMLGVAFNRTRWIRGGSMR